MTSHSETVEIRVLDMHSYVKVDAKICQTTVVCGFELLIVYAFFTHVCFRIIKSWYTNANSRFHGATIISIVHHQLYPSYKIVTIMQHAIFTK